MNAVPGHGAMGALLEALLGHVLADLELIELGETRVSSVLLAISDVLGIHIGGILGLELG